MSKEKESGFRLVKSETIFVPRSQAVEMAKAHHEMPKSPTERDYDPKRTAELIERIKAGVWLPCQWATVSYEQTKYRMNGQHSSAAIAECPEEILPQKLAIHLDHFDAPDAEAMGVLFRQFDARISSRTKQDVSGAYQGLVPELRELSKKKVKLGMEGIAWFNRAIEGIPVPSGDDLYFSLLKPAYHSFLRWLNSILVHGKTKELERPAVIAGMYESFITSESGAQEFWAHVAKNDLTDDTDARSVLSHDYTEAADPEKRADPLKPMDYFGKYRKAWGAFRAGDKVRTLNVNAKKGITPLAA